MYKTLFALAIGSFLGGLLRWQLGLKFNTVFSSIPLGTLYANFIAAFVIGIAIGVFNSFPSLSPEWKIFLITGFCGGLSTFSSFSAEALTLITEEKYMTSCLHILAHVVGSIFLVFVGLSSVNFIKRIIHLSV